MTTNELKQLIENQIAGRWDETNLHGIDLRTTLIQPHKIRIIHRRVLDEKFDDEIIEVWLVLEEDKEKQEGYKIIYNESNGMFGLATDGFPTDQHPVLVGFYVDFWATFKAM